MTTLFRLHGSEHWTHVWCRDLDAVNQRASDFDHQYPLLVQDGHVARRVFNSHKGEQYQKTVLYAKAED